jgi:hypothetical protein
MIDRGPLDYTLIIPTRNRNALLSRLLCYL